MSETQLDNLLTLIGEKIAEDDRIARAARGATWVVGSTGGLDGRTRYGTHVAAMAPSPRMVADMTDGFSDSLDVANCEHIARQGPARTVDQCDALRDAVMEVQRIAERSPDPDSRMWARAALRRLALIWLDVGELDRLWMEWAT